MTNADPPEVSEPVALIGDEAVTLWRQGKDEWNTWIDAHPGAQIEFNGVDFGHSKTSFSGYQFGDGDVSFAGAKFGNSTVSFEGAIFGAGKVSFCGANFGNGRVVFSRTNFGKGDVSFADVKFRDCVLSFDGAIFGAGKISFYKTTFGNGGVSFKGVNFGKGKLSFASAVFRNSTVSFDDAIFGDDKTSFYRAEFGEGTVSFKNADFGKGPVIFSEAGFGKGPVIFSGATFGVGDVFFRNTKFGEGLVSFSDVYFGGGDVSFKDATCTRIEFAPKAICSDSFSAGGMKVEGPATFKLPSSATRLKQFDLRGAVFDGPLTLEGKLTAPPDLRSVKAAHHVELGGLEVSLRLDKGSWSWPPKLSRVAENSEDAARLRRLKEIAENNRDHRAALRFSADENQALRWHKTPWLASVLDMGFCCLSDYGQSIMRPLAWLFIVVAGCVALYFHLSDVVIPEWSQAALLSIGNSLPFLPQSRTLRIEASEALFCNGPGLWIDIAMVAQGTASVVLLFLIGLGLRNRFRL